MRLTEMDLTNRRLQRAAVSSAGSEDQARALSSRLRSGELPYERVAAASALGDPLAKMLDLDEPRLGYSAHEKIEKIIKQKILPYEDIVNFTGDCVEQVLLKFENAWDDARPRRAFIAAKSLALGESVKNLPRILEDIGDAVTAYYDDENSWSGPAVAAVSQYISAAPGTNWSERQQRFKSAGVDRPWAYRGSFAGAVRAAHHAGLSDEWIDTRLIDYLLGRT